MAHKALALTDERRPDAIILDLEDGVAPSSKPRARAAAVELLRDGRPDGRGDGGPQRWLRVNSGALLIDDIAALADGAVDGGRLDGICLAKATLAAVGDLARMLDETSLATVPIAGLIESAAGLLDAVSMARHPRVVALAIGEADLGASLRLEPSPDDRELVPLRMQVVVACAAGGIDPPTGPVATRLRDHDALRSSTTALRRMGFGARSAIHPDQVAIINEVMRPSEAEVAAARALVERYDAAVANGDGVIVSGDGSMIDEAVVRSARRLL